MSADIRSQLRALFERELPAVHDRAEGPDGLFTDRLVLEVFSALLRDPDRHRSLVARDPEDQRRWLLDRVDEADAPPSGSGDPDDPGECIRPAATDWVDRYFAGNLAPSSEPGLWGHLDDCPACRVRYRALRAEEGEGDESGQRRIRRLARGLPWSEVPEVDAEPGPEPEPEPEPEPDTTGDEEAPKTRYWLTPRGRWIVYGVSASLAILGSVLLLLSAPARDARLEEETPRIQAVKPLPDQGLVIALLRYQPSSLHDMPWRNVQAAVAAGDRLLLTFSLDEGRGKQKGRPRFLTIAAIDDKGRIHWLHPTARLPAHRTSPPVAVPVRAARLPRELRAPKGVERLVIYAVVTDVPVRLAIIGRALLGAFRRPDFATTPPILAVDRSIQYHLVLDVLR